MSANTTGDCIAPLYTDSVAIQRVSDEHGHAGIAIVFLDGDGKKIDERILRFNDGHRAALDILTLLKSEGVMA